jgi:hypothetical protein
MGFDVVAIDCRATAVERRRHVCLDAMLSVSEFNRASKENGRAQVVFGCRKTPMNISVKTELLSQQLIHAAPRGPANMFLVFLP